MTIRFTDDQVRRLRARAQGLRRESAEASGVASIVRAMAGAQAQDGAAAALSVAARGTGLTVAEVEAARARERTVVRTWLMRGTLHLVAAEDLDWLLALLGPVFARAGIRRRTELGINQEVSERSLDVISDLLAERGPLTRAELAELLAARGFPTAGQATIHLIGHAALRGFLSFGPERNGEPTFVLLRDWVTPGSRHSREAALAELATRYLAAFGPAEPRDFAAWSGLAMVEAREGWSRIAAGLVEVEMSRGLAWMLRSQVDWIGDTRGDASSVRLLPAYDTYLLGYRGRELAVSAGQAKRVHPGGGVLRPTLLVDGRVAGIWRVTRRARRLEIVVEPFEEPGVEMIAALDAEVEVLGRILDRPAELRLGPR